MKAIIITQPGGSEVLHLAEREIPAYAANEVLIKVAAAGVNRPDIAQREGKYPAPVGASQDIPGLEIAGTVVATGASVTRWKVGDRLCALVTGGGYAEYCNAPEGQCLPIPKDMLFIEAASLPETFFTVWSNVFDRGQLMPNETLLVHGGSSGIGVAAIQMARARGNKIYVTVGSDEKAAFCESLGANKAINYKTKNFEEEIKRLTSGKGVDVILDMVGGDYTTPNLNCLAYEGRLVLINAMRGSNVQIDLFQIMVKRLTLTGSTLRSRDIGFKTSIAKNLEEKIWPLLVAKEIKPVIAEVFSAKDAHKAHELMESSKHMGKIVLNFEV